MLNLSDVLQTNNMISEQKLDIRTIPLGLR